MLRTIGHVFTNPLYIFFILLGIGFILYRNGHRKSWKVLLGIAGIGFLASVTSPIPNYLAVSLESQYKRWSHGQYGESPKSPHIVVLGAGFTNDTTLRPTQQLSKTALGRLVEGYRIYRQFNNSKLVTSGPEKNDVNAMGKIVAKASLELGVDPNDTIQMWEPFNTASEARFYAQRFPEKEEIILVTNALHMKRAMYWFQHYGKQPIPAPTNYEVKTDAFDRGRFIGISPSYMEKLGKALHEYAGLCYAYWLTG